MSDDDKKQTIAIAINYEGKENKSPIVTAKGKGKLAEQILDLAFEHGVKVRQDEDLVEVLEAVEVGDEIPLKALAAVSDILAYVYGLNEREKL